MKTAEKRNSFMQLGKNYSSFENSKAVIIPFINSVSKEKKNSFVNGIFSASKKIEPYDEEMSSEIFTSHGVSTLEPISLIAGNSKKGFEKAEKIISQVIEKEKTAVTICQNYYASLCVLSSYSKKIENLTILQLDAYARLKNEQANIPFEKTLMNKVSETNKKIIQVGIRSMSKEENDYRLQNNIRQFLACEIKLGMFGADWQELVNRELSEKVYITLDLSCFDPSVIDEVENPEPGGLFWDDVQYLLKIIGQDKQIVGVNITGFEPHSAKSYSNYFVAKLIYKILNYALHKS